MQIAFNGQRAKSDFHTNPGKSVWVWNSFLKDLLYWSSPLLCSTPCLSCYQFFGLWRFLEFARLLSFCSSSRYLECVFRNHSLNCNRNCSTTWLEMGKRWQISPFPSSSTHTPEAMCFSCYANLCLYCFPNEEGQTYLVANFIWGCAIGKVLNYFRTKDMHLKSKKTGVALRWEGGKSPVWSTGSRPCWANMNKLCPTHWGRECWE